MSEKIKYAGCVQDTGNPVFDATCNLIMSTGACSIETINQVHETLLDLYAKEPRSGSKPSSVKAPHTSRGEIQTFAGDG